MKKTMALVLMVTTVAVIGCRSSSPKGGIMEKEQGFTIQVRRFALDIKQGDVKAVKISLKRGDYFKQDVRLQVLSSEGLTVEPSDVWVKASDKPEVELKLTAATDAALGKYRLLIKGSPEIGESASTELTVEVKAR